MTGTPAEQAPTLVVGALPPASYTPLYDPDREEGHEPGDVRFELRGAHRLLDEVAAANIHDHTEMLVTAVRLDYRLRSLVAALHAERGEQP
ncbi:hypothetical protein QF032_003768 [Streptomyces achromogenes]|uniref:hypothetical protein n=1 Tax=Streptomyces achromogenes TaxID=67255 RepID=UPI002788E14A|nr:hypothetical protein [Streptomyces achromogenes]MDQ0831924.1 hypothetical protein [Streptomyces achromogenes]